MAYSLKELLGQAESLDPELMGGPLRFMFWSLSRQIIKSGADWDKHMQALTHDERFCVQSHAKRREFRDRLTISLVKGNSMRDKPVNEMTWNRALMGLALLEAENCTFEVKARKKLRRRDIEKVRSVSFNPTLLVLNRHRTDADKVIGIGERMKRYLEDPQVAVSEMNHPLGSLYWALVGEFNAHKHWEQLMEKYLSNPDNCEQLRQHRNDRYSNIKKAICNTVNLTWARFCQSLLALAIDEIEFTIIITTRSDETFTVTHTVDMSSLKFIKIGEGHE
jgi:hypothetical protein